MHGEREFAWGMGVEKTEFIRELMIFETKVYMTVDDICEARVCMRVEKRECA
jgi:hypothetical protein